MTKLSIDRFGVILEDEDTGFEKHIDFEDMNKKKFDEIIEMFDSEISMLEADRDFIKDKFKLKSLNKKGIL